MQGVMISERPDCNSPVAVASGGFSVAGSIGNYKGVMLCNRPFAGTAAAAKGGHVAAAVGKQVFVTGKVKSEVGFSGKNTQTEKMLRKHIKQETALTRHRRWLADLQRTKQALEDQHTEDQRKKEENRRRFSERETRMRQMTREIKVEVEGQDDDASVPRDGDNGEEETRTTCPAKPEGDSGSGRKSKTRRGQTEEDLHVVHVHESSRGNGGDSAELRAAEKRRKRDGKLCRPMWALTKEKAEAENELKHEEEVEELLEFTQGLDFSKYIKDAEVQSMIDQVKRRIAEIEARSQANDKSRCDGDDSGCDKRNPDEDEARLEARVMELTDSNLRKIASEGKDTPATRAHEEDGVEDDNVSVARTALSEGGRSIRSVHSTKSLAVMAEKARTGILDACNPCGRKSEAEDGEDVVPVSRGLDAGRADLVDEFVVRDLTVVTHKDDGGLRLGGKNTVSNLAYIRRNPAV